MVRLVKVVWAGRAPLAEVVVRRLLATVGRARGNDCVTLWAARAAAQRAVAATADAADSTATAAAVILARGDALAAGDLAVTGAVLMESLGIPPSREIGRLLEVALDAVLDDPSRNNRDHLLALAQSARAS